MTFFWCYLLIGFSNSSLLIDQIHTPTAIIGILTTSRSHERRALIRSTYLHHRPKKMDVFFALCSRPIITENNTLKEIDEKGDIILLNCTENMNEGKTHVWFTYVFEHFLPYKFVLKGDDDTFIHLENLQQDLILQPQNNIFYGRICNNYPAMAGMLYGMSWNLVEYVATDQWVRANVIGPEDFITYTWMKRNNAIFISKEAEFYDHKEAKSTSWSKDYVENTIAIHQCKQNERMIDAYFKLLKH